MESKFYFIRHEVHGENGMPKQALTPDARERSIQVGQRLAEMGVTKFDYTACSFQPRAVETLLCVMQGQGKLIPVHTSHAIADAVSGEFALTPEQRDRLKADAKATGIDAEEYLLTEDQFAEWRINRGNEGADYIEGLVKANPGKIGSGASHGGSRMEVVVMELMRRSPHFENPMGTPFLFERGSIAELVFDDQGNLTKVTYLGNLTGDSLVFEGK